MNKLEQMSIVYGVSEFELEEEIDMWEETYVAEHGGFDEDCYDEE